MSTAAPSMSSSPLDDTLPSFNMNARGVVLHSSPRPRSSLADAYIKSHSACSATDATGGEKPLPALPPIVPGPSSATPGPRKLELHRTLSAYLGRPMSRTPSGRARSATMPAPAIPLRAVRHSVYMYEIYEEPATGGGASGWLGRTRIALGARTGVSAGRQLTDPVHAESDPEDDDSDTAPLLRGTEGARVPLHRPGVAIEHTAPWQRRKLVRAYSYSFPSSGLVDDATVDVDELDDTVLEALYVNAALRARGFRYEPARATLEP